MNKRKPLKDNFKLLMVSYKSMVAGREPLVRTFWLWGVVGMIVVLMIPLFILILLYLALFGEPTLVFALFINLLWLAYGITVAVGIWRSANAYQGPRIFLNAAKLFVVIGLLFWIQQIYDEMPELLEEHRTEDAEKTTIDIVTPALENLLTKSKNGDPEAQYQLGLMFENGEGVNENDRIALELYFKAATQGHAKAQYNLALMYYFGKGGVRENDAESEKWLRLAADEGLADAQFRLGGMYLAGIGMSEDLVLGYMWWNLATAQGYKLPSGKKASVGLQELRQKMNSKQIAEAERLTREWLDKHP